MKPYLIAIAGPSCSGKTFLSKQLARHLQATLINLDSYYNDLAHLELAKRAHSNFDAPESLDSSLLIAQVDRLSRGESIDQPVYDFTTHCRTNRVERISPAGFVIIEGLFALYWEEIRALAKTKVFVDLPENKCLARRVSRDIAERGRTRESVLKQFATTVQPMAERYVLPTRRHADLVLTGDDDIQREVELVLAHIRSSAAAAL